MNRRSFLALATLLSCDVVFGSEKEQKDIFLNDTEKDIFYATLDRLNLVKSQVGFANFNLISYDDVLRVAKNVSKIGAFKKEEQDLIEKLFYEDVNKYGFFGKRTCESLTEKINKKDTVKIPKTGHYLFKGESLESYEKVIKDIGPSLILTSGIRSIPKQLNLYMQKIYSCEGNISLASKSLAPPAHSYHSIGDFDVGKIGLGADNFTEKFAHTEEFWKLRELKYITMRYEINNKDGVRFEPWHVQIV